MRVVIRHTLSNSTKVYVSGDASNPYKLADVDTIISLLRRRDQTDHQRAFLMQRATDRADRVVPLLDEFFQVSVIPAFPRLPLCSVDQAWNHSSQFAFRSGRFFPPDSWRRAQDAFIYVTPGWDFGEVSTYGLVLLRRRIEQITFPLRRNSQSQMSQLRRCSYHICEGDGVR